MPILNHVIFQKEKSCNEPCYKEGPMYWYFSRKTCFRYSLESLSQGISNEYQQHMYTFVWRTKKNIHQGPVVQN